MADEDFRIGSSPREEVGQHVPPDTNPPTGGDMLKSVYDPDDDGKVVSAASADNATNATTAQTAVAVQGVAGSGLSHYYGTNEAGVVGVWPLPASGGGAGSSTFLGLSDTPASYVGAAGYAVVVNATENGLEFQAVAIGSGDMTKAVYDTNDDGKVDAADLADNAILPEQLLRHGI